MKSILNKLKFICNIPNEIIFLLNLFIYFIIIKVNNSSNLEYNINIFQKNWYHYSNKSGWLSTFENKSGIAFVFIFSVANHCPTSLIN